MRRRGLLSQPGRDVPILAVLPLEPMRPAMPARRFDFRNVDDGSAIIWDRAAATQFHAYLPKSQRQFDGGHRPRLWYVRPSGEAGNAPTSRAFATFGDLVDALRDGTWDLLPSAADQKPVKVRAACDSATPGPTSRSSSSRSSS